MTSPSETPGSLQYALNHYRMPLFFVAIGAFLSIGGFMLAISKQTGTLEKDFLSLAKSYATAIDERLTVFQEKMHGAYGIAAVSGDGETEASRDFAESVIARIPFTLMGWLPASGETPFARMRPGADFPLSLADMVAMPQGAQGIMFRRGVRMAISRPFCLPQADAADCYIVLSASVMRQNRMHGTVIGVVNMKELFSADPEVMRQATVYLFDGAAEEKPFYTAGEVPPSFSHISARLPDLTKRSAFHYMQALQSTGGGWRVVFVPTPHYLVRAIASWAWIVLAGGLLVTGLVGYVTFQQVRQGLIISRQVQVQTQLLRDSANRLQVVFNTVLDGLITINSHAIVQSFNASAERVFGYKAEEVIGRNVKMLMPDPYHAEHDRYVSNYLRTGEAKVIGIGREVMARRKDGSVFPMELGISEFAVGTERAFVGMIRDITQRKAAEAEKEKLIRDLKRSNQELDDFAYIASHDLKEPLRGLFNNAKFLEEDYHDRLDSEGVKRLQRLGYLCQRMETLVNDLLYFSRLGRQELAVQKTDLNIIIHDIEAMIETTLKENRACILVPQRMPEITCDKTRIAEVFRNLIVNGVKYNNKPEKIIEVGWLSDMDTFYGYEKEVFYVRDNGIGIETEFHEEVFRIFKRLNEEDDSKKGTGVGLTFVKKIIERHGGRIWLESEPGKGTAFYFTIKQGERAYGQQAA